MKQDLNNQEDAAQGAELEMMLGDAYDVPAVPRSLLKKLDRSVEREWGVSPRLVAGWLPRFSGAQSDSSPSGMPPLSRVVRGGARIWKAWPIAASLAIAAFAVALLQERAHAYSWAKLLDALSQANVVQTVDAAGGNVRWMSLSEAVVGERTRRRSRLFDFRRGVILERVADEQRVTRHPFDATANLSRREAVVLAFLLNNIDIDAATGPARQPQIQVTGERWSPAGDEVSLRVELSSESKSSALKITLDRGTHLPKQFEVFAGAEQRVAATAVSYPRQNTNVYLARDFPSELPIIDSQPAAAVAANETQPLSAAGSSVDAVAGEAADNLPLVGAASLKWQAVQTTELSTHEAVGRIDAILGELWKDRHIEPAPLASDEELLRRVYLDLAGRTPSVSEVRDYLADASEDRYARLVDRLLASRDHATHVATTWRTFLIPEGLDLSKFGGTESFERWMGEQLLERVPYDEMVRRLLQAEGRLAQAGPLLFYAAAKLDPDQLATRSARVFLGMRLDCAQCHDDHFEPWLQEDFWSYAAFFAQISRPQGVLNNVSTVMRVRDADQGEVQLPESETVVGPRFLDGSPAASQGQVARRRQLAEWLTDDDNPFFARATANRVWGQLFGKGIVNPVDGFGTQHQPVSQELLDQVAGHFIASGYDLRELFRSIVLSRAYRSSSGAETPDPRRHELFAQMNVKLLTAEQMYDCITVAAMLTSAEAGTGFSLARVGNTSRAEFLAQFRSPPGRATEYQAGIPQALTLMNGGLITSATGLAASGLLKSLEVPVITNSERIEILYLATLARRPTSSEQELLSEYITDQTTGEELYASLSDVLWALLNSAEFAMNH